MKLEIDDLVDAAIAVVKHCELDGPGRYKRWAVPMSHPNIADPEGLNPYGVADAANLLYTLNEMPREEETHRGFIEALGSMQDAETGLFHEGTHHSYHTTAHCVAAMELFEAVPPHPLEAMMPDTTSGGIVQRLDGLDWTENPWGQSHQGAGVYVSVKLSRQLDADAERAFEEAYFNWLYDEFDEGAGMLRKGHLPGQAEGSRPIHEHMAGTFHYLFNIEAARRPLPYPEAMIDTCLTMHEDGSADEKLYGVGFLMIDWVYCLTRARRRCGHRFNDVQEALRAAAERYIGFLRSLDHETHNGFNDLHGLFGVFTALAELQIALPGEIRTRRPLRNVLDRRPFI